MYYPNRVLLGQCFSTSVGIRGFGPEVKERMEYKELLDVSNFTIAALTRSIYRMGLSGELINTQVADEYAADDIIQMLVHSGLKIEGSTPEELTQSFLETMNKLGAVGKVEFPDVSDTEVTVTLKDCVMNTVVSLTKASHPDAIPVCAWMSILSASMLKSTGKVMTVSDYSWDAGSNTCKFKLTME